MKLPKYITVDRVGLVLLLVFLLILNKCHNDAYRGESAKVDSLTLENQKLTTVHNKDGQTIAMQQAIVTSNQAAIKDLTDSIFKLKKTQQKQIKKVIAYYTARTNTHVDTVKIPIDSQAVKKFSDSLEKACADVIKFYRDSSIQVPATITDTSSPYFKFSATLLKDSIVLNHISFPDSQYIRFTELKGGIFRRDAYGKFHIFLRRSIRVESFHTNPYVTELGQNSVIYVPKTRLRWLEDVIIAGAGIYVGSRLH